MRFFPASRRSGPWFLRWPIGTAAVAALLYAGIFALRLSSGGAAEATTMFYVLPIALLAVTFGLWGGLGGGLIAVGMVVIWVASEHVALSPMGWATRAVPMLLLGVLLGQASDLLRRSEAERARLDAAAHWHRQAVELNDSIVQGLDVAKWSLEAGRTENALKIVNETLDSAHGMVSQLLRDAELAPGGTHEPRGTNGSGSPSTLSGGSRRTTKAH